jgi:hypothetical protein
VCAYQLARRTALTCDSRGVVTGAHSAARPARRAPRRGRSWTRSPWRGHPASWTPSVIFGSVCPSRAITYGTSAPSRAAARRTSGAAGAASPLLRSGRRDRPGLGDGCGSGTPTTPRPASASRPPHAHRRRSWPAPIAMRDTELFRGHTEAPAVDEQHKRPVLEGNAMRCIGTTPTAVRSQPSTVAVASARSGSRAQGAISGAQSAKSRGARCLARRSRTHGKPSPSSGPVACRPPPCASPAVVLIWG